MTIAAAIRSLDHDASFGRSHPFLQDHEDATPLHLLCATAKVEKPTSSQAHAPHAIHLVAVKRVLRSTSKHPHSLTQEPDEFD